MIDFEPEQLTFQKACKASISLIKSWLKKERIKEYWGDGGLTLPDLELFVSGKKSIFSHYFGYYLDRPIVFIMKSELEEGHHWEKWKEPGKVNLSLDMMIGDDQFVGKGIAHLLIDKFIEVECQGAGAVFVDPEAEHSKAIHVYKKSGFIPQGIYSPSTGAWAGVDHLILKKVL